MRYLLLLVLLVGCENLVEPEVLPATVEVQVVEPEPYVLSFMAVVRNFRGEALTWVLSSDSILLGDGSSVSQLSGVSLDGNIAIAVRYNPANQTEIRFDATAGESAASLTWRSY